MQCQQRGCNCLGLLRCLLLREFPNASGVCLLLTFNMEADILKSLRYELGVPTVKTFLRCVPLLILCPYVALILVVLVAFFLACCFTLYALRLFAGDSLELARGRWCKFTLVLTHLLHLIHKLKSDFINSNVLYIRWNCQEKNFAQFLNSIELENHSLKFYL